MKKICQTLWERDPFKILVIFFSCLRDEVHTFYPIFLKLAQISCIIIDINTIENEENKSNIMGKESFQILVKFFSFT